MVGLAATFHTGGSGVDLQIVNAHDRVLHLVASANQRPQPGQQLLQLEGLRQIVIRPEVQTADFIVDTAPGGENQDMALHPGPPPTLEERKSIFFGEHEVKDDYVVIGSLGLVSSLLAVERSVDRETFFLQPSAKSTDERLVIFDEQYPHERPPSRGSMIVAAEPHPPQATGTAPFHSKPSAKIAKTYCSVKKAAGVTGV